MKLYCFTAFAKKASRIGRLPHVLPWTVGGDAIASALYRAASPPGRLRGARTRDLLGSAPNC